MNSTSLFNHPQPFLDYLEEWLETLPAPTLAETIPHPEQTAILSVDVIKGFCSSGPLSSQRVAAIIKPIVNLMQAGWDHGVRQIVLIQDNHEPDAVEFDCWPPHCVRGTEEAETVEEIKRLPFFEQMVIFPKNSISSGLNTGLNDWLADHPEANIFLVVGDCTDLCTYQLAMHLRLDANAHQLNRRVIVPVNCVETYDRPVATAQSEGGLPHPGDLLHGIFLYHMALNGVEVIQRIGY